MHHEEADHTTVTRALKRRRDEPSEVVADRIAELRQRQQTQEAEAAAESDACTTTSESSEDEDDWEGMEPPASAFEERKRRRLEAEEEELREELVGLRATVVRVEAQVSVATAKLRELRSLVEQLVAAEAQREPSCLDM
jgi:hypothetical protein